MNEFIPTLYMRKDGEGRRKRESDGHHNSRLRNCIAALFKNIEIDIPVETVTKIGLTRAIPSCNRLSGDIPSLK